MGQRRRRETARQRSSAFPLVGTLGSKTAELSGDIITWTVLSYLFKYCLFPFFWESYIFPPKMILKSAKIPCRILISAEFVHQIIMTTSWPRYCGSYFDSSEGSTRNGHVDCESRLFLFVFCLFCRHFLMLPLFSFQLTYYWCLNLLDLSSQLLWLRLKSLSSRMLLQSRRTSHPHQVSYFYVWVFFCKPVFDIFVWKIGHCLSSCL